MKKALTIFVDDDVDIVGICGMIRTVGTVGDSAKCERCSFVNAKFHEGIIGVIRIHKDRTDVELVTEGPLDAREGVTKK